MTAAVRLVAGAMLITACEAGGPPAPSVIPGPAVPSTVPTSTPFVWDAREELAVWVDNQVTRGSFVVEGADSAAFIRLDRTDREWVLRGPDLTPPAFGIRTLRIRYRWVPDASLPATAARSLLVQAYFQTVTPIHTFDPTAQAVARIDLAPRIDWTEVSLTPGQFTPPVDVEYCYLHSFGANRGVLELDRLELVR